MLVYQAVPWRAVHLLSLLLPTADQKGWRLSLIQATGWKGHSGEPEYATQKEAQKIIPQSQGKSGGRDCFKAVFARCAHIWISYKSVCHCLQHILPPMDMDDDSSLKVQKNFICDHCYGAFRSSYHLKRHILTHTGDNWQPVSWFCCGLCGN